MKQENKNRYPQLEAIASAFCALGYTNTYIDHDDCADDEIDNTSVAVEVESCTCCIWYVDGAKGAYYELHVFNAATGDEGEIYCRTPLQVMQRVAEFIS